MEYFSSARGTAREYRREKPGCVDIGSTPMTFPSRMATVRLMMIAAGAGLWLALPAAPLLAANSFPRAAGLIYLLFSPVCHQLAERSFACQGFPWAVCHRCSGIYLGLLLGLLLPFKLCLLATALRRRRAWVCLASAPLLLDVLLGRVQIWQSQAVVRFGTGLLFGIMLASLLLSGTAEAFAVNPAPSTRCCGPMR